MIRTTKRIPVGDTERPLLYLDTTRFSKASLALPANALWGLDSSVNFNEDTSKWTTIDSTYEFTKYSGSVSIGGEAYALNNVLPIHFVNGIVNNAGGAGLPSGNSPRAFSALCRVINAGGSSWSYMIGYGTNSSGQSFTIQTRQSGGTNWSIGVWFNESPSSVPSVSSEPCLITLTHDGTTTSLLKNGTIIASGLKTLNVPSQNFGVGGLTFSSSETTGEVYIWEVLGWDHDVVGNMPEILAYFNKKYKLALT